MKRGITPVVVAMHMASLIMHAGGSHFFSLPSSHLSSFPADWIIGGSPPSSGWLLPGVFYFLLVAAKRMLNKGFSMEDDKVYIIICILLLTKF